MAGERTELGQDTYVLYRSGHIELEQEGNIGGIVYLDADMMVAFDKWRAELDADIKLREEAGF